MPLFQKEKKSLIILISLIFFQLVLISLQVPLGEEQNYIEKAIFYCFSPIQHGVVSFFQAVSSIWKNYFYLIDVQKENQSLRKELIALRQENIILKNNLQSFDIERKIQDKLSKIDENILVARVIGLDAHHLNESIIINKGSQDGMKKDMVILDKMGNLVGRIIGPISLKESRVQLITDNESGISVVSEKKKICGVLTGDRKGLCVFKYILATEDNISIGENILTSGYDGIFIPEIQVGQIVSVKESTSLFKQIKVKPFFDFRHLDHVAVIIGDVKEII